MRSIEVRVRRCRVHARRIARLLARERQITAQAAQLRQAIDRAVLAARCDRVPHAEVASEYLQLVGAAGTADEHDRVVGRLRQRAAVAAARTSARGADASELVIRSAVREAAVMNSTTPYRRRIVEEWYDTGLEVPREHDVEHRDHEEDLDSPVLRGDEGIEHADLAGDEDDEDDDEDDGEDEDD